jgi:hypothetical protein
VAINIGSLAEGKGIGLMTTGGGRREERGKRKEELV